MSFHIKISGSKKICRDNRSISICYYDRNIYVIKLKLVEKIYNICWKSLTKNKKVK